MIDRLTEWNAGQDWETRKMETRQPNEQPVSRGRRIAIFMMVAFGLTAFVLLVAATWRLAEHRDEMEMRIMQQRGEAALAELVTDIEAGGGTPCKWYSFADITVGRGNVYACNTAQADGWSYGDREVIDQIVSEREPGTKFTLFHPRDSVSLPWSFAGRSSQTNIRAFLYGVHYTYPDGSVRHEFRIHGSLPLSTWHVKGPRSPVEEAMNEELKL